MSVLNLCWFCDQRLGPSHGVDGLCASCSGKADNVDVPMKMEEFERMRIMYKLVASAVFAGIQAADEASAEALLSEESDKR